MPSTRTMVLLRALRYALLASVMGRSPPAVAEPVAFVSEAGLSVQTPIEAPLPLMIDTTGHAIVRSVAATGGTSNKLWCLPLGRGTLDGSDHALTEALERPVGWPDDWDETLARPAEGPGFAVLMIASSTRQILVARFASCEAAPEVLGTVAIPESVLAVGERLATDPSNPAALLEDGTIVFGPQGLSTGYVAIDTAARPMTLSQPPALGLAAITEALRRDFEPTYHGLLRAREPDRFHLLGQALIDPDGLRELIVVAPVPGNRILIAPWVGARIYRMAYLVDAHAETTPAEAALAPMFRYEEVAAKQLAQAKEPAQYLTEDLKDIFQAVPVASLGATLSGPIFDHPNVASGASSTFALVPWTATHATRLGRQPLVRDADLRHVLEPSTQYWQGYTSDPTGQLYARYADLVPKPDAVHEVRRLTFDAARTDLDQDGLGMAQEAALGTYDLARDSDDDGAEDGSELGLLGTSPTVADPPDRVDTHPLWGMSLMANDWPYLGRVERSNAAFQVPASGHAVCGQFRDVPLDQYVATCVDDDGEDLTPTSVPLPIAWTPDRAVAFLNTLAVAGTPPREWSEGGLARYDARTDTHDAIAIPAELDVIHARPLVAFSRDAFLFETGTPAVLYRWADGQVDALIDSARTDCPVRNAASDPCPFLPYQQVGRFALAGVDEATRQAFFAVDTLYASFIVAITADHVQFVLDASSVVGDRRVDAFFPDGSGGYVLATDRLDGADFQSNAVRLDARLSPVDRPTLRDDGSDSTYVPRRQASLTVTGGYLRDGLWGGETSGTFAWVLVPGGAPDVPGSVERRLVVLHHYGTAAPLGELTHLFAAEKVLRTSITQAAEFPAWALWAIDEHGVVAPYLSEETFLDLVAGDTMVQSSLAAAPLGRVRGLGRAPDGTVCFTEPAARRIWQWKDRAIRLVASDIPAVACGYDDDGELWWAAESGPIAVHLPNGRGVPFAPGWQPRGAVRADGIIALVNNNNLTCIDDDGTVRPTRLTAWAVALGPAVGDGAGGTTHFVMALDANGWVSGGRLSRLCDGAEPEEDATGGSRESFRKDQVVYTYTHPFGAGGPMVSVEQPALAWQDGGTLLIGVTQVCPGLPDLTYPACHLDPAGANVLSRLRPRWIPYALAVPIDMRDYSVVPELDAVRNADNSAGVMSYLATSITAITSVREPRMTVRESEDWRWFLQPAPVRPSYAEGSPDAEPTVDDSAEEVEAAAESSPSTSCDCRTTTGRVTGWPADLLAPFLSVLVLWRRRRLAHACAPHGEQPHP